MKLLFLGDVFGKPGRKAVQRLVPRLISRHGIDLVVANAENAANGVGVTPEPADELLAAEVNLLTSGNHIWSKREIVPYLDGQGSKLLRPANYPQGAPGRGRGVAETPDGRKLGVVNLEGRVFMKNLDDPFRAAERAGGALKRRAARPSSSTCTARPPARRTPWAGSSTARSRRCSAPTPTCRPPTQRVLPGGTAFITDVGMCGPWDSIIGVKKELVLERFLTQRPVAFEPARRDVWLQGAIVDIDDATGKARSIERVQEKDEEQ